MGGSVPVVNGGRLLGCLWLAASSLVCCDPRPPALASQSLCWVQIRSPAAETPALGKSWSESLGGLFQQDFDDVAESSCRGCIMRSGPREGGEDQSTVPRGNRLQSTTQPLSCLV